jgi:hypothetical protein
VQPHWVGPISWFLGPTWGFRAIDRAAVGGDAWPSIAMCVAVSAAYLAASVVFLDVFERLARSRATLRLA